MATVYLADDIKHERKVALKVLKPELAAVVGPDGRFVMVKMAPGTFRQFKVIRRWRQWPRWEAEAPDPWPCGSGGN